MNNCYLCNNSEDLSLEHSIPRFLGGAGSDDKFKKINMCKKCNSKLGLQIDGKFAHTTIIEFSLNEIFSKEFTVMPALDLSSQQELKNLLQPNTSIDMCLGNGLTCFWLKENSDDYHNFSGGHPIKSKKPSKMFIFLNEPTDGSNITFDEIKSKLTALSLFVKKRKEIEFLLCINFEIDLPNELNNYIEQEFPKNKLKNKHSLKIKNNFDERENALAELLKPKNEKLRMTLIIDENINIRFLAKLFLGVLCGYLGNDFVYHPVGIDLQKIILTYLDNNPVSKELRSRYQFILKNSNSLGFGQQTVSICLSNYQNEIIGYLEIDGMLFKLKVCASDDLSDEIKLKLNMKSNLRMFKKLGLTPAPTGYLLRYNRDTSKYEELSLEEFVLGVNPEIQKLISSFDIK